MPRALHLTLLILVLASAACSRERSQPPPPEPERFDIALLTSGSIADSGWNAAAYEGVRRVQEELGAAAAQNEVRLPADRHAQMRLMGASRFEVVFAHGAEFQNAARAAAPSFPGTVFIVTYGDGIGPNLAPLHFRLEEATWILGMAAASESKRARGGAVAATRSPSTASAFDAFRSGAKSVRPDFEMDESYTDDPRDREAARRAALHLIDGGADVLIHAAGEASPGVLAACVERKVLCFASPRNQNDLAPGVLLASAVVDVAAAMSEITSLVQGGRFQPRLFSYGMKEGVVTILWNEELRRRIPPDAMRRIDETEAAIRDGRMRVPRTRP